VSGALRVLRLDSAAGRRALDRFERRAGRVLDAATLRGAARIVQQVRRGGDAALLELARRLDGAEATSAVGLALGPPRLEAEAPGLPAGFAAALEEAIAAVERFHRPQVPAGFVLEGGGARLEERVLPLGRVGVYVPGGRASYPSTAVMTVVPARLARVREVVVATPPAAYRASAALRYTLARLGVTEVWGMGGAHAVAALAYGTASVRRVDAVVGPGNAWVTAAKRLVAGDVAIDGLAGPTEVVIVADGDGEPEADLAGTLAADLLAQAEHDPSAAAVLVTTSRALAERVAAEVERQLATLPTAATARAALAGFGAALLVEDFEEALALVERLAPEHLQLVGPRAEALAERVMAAGAVFVGVAAGEVLGDYMAGPSHVLPTCGSARFASALGVETFLRRAHVVRFTPAAAAARAGAAAILADAEGLPAHAVAARRRSESSSWTEGGPLDLRTLVRPELRALPAYHLDQTPCRHKLDQNEVPWEPPRRLKRRVAEALLAADWARYPDFHADALRHALGDLHGHPWQGVLVGNGSNELLGLALEALARPGGEVLGAEPSFGLYRMFVTRAGAVPRFLPPRPDLRLPIDELLAEVERDPRRPLLLCSPNNPTGAAATSEEVEALLARLEAPLLLDNAYGEFCRHEYRPLLARHPHLLLFRTFSKAWSLAGLRLGYLLGHPGLVAELIKVKLPYNLGHAAALAGGAALAERQAAARRVAVLLGRRPQWAAALAAAGLEVFPSEANFLLVRCGAGGEARRIRDGLAARGILVRDVGSYPGLAGCLRVSVGSGAALRAVRTALTELAVPPAQILRCAQDDVEGSASARPPSMERR
jgi:histidinol dehydrogenase